jgi:tetratricopeptide (TPR) repeat protein
LRIVGDNAELYAALGRTHLQYRESGIDLSDAPLLEAERCARRVAELDPASRGGAALLGWIRYAQGDIRSAVRALEDARVTDPACADVLALLCNCYLISGRVARARPLIAGLLSVDPLTPLSRCMPGFADLMEGRLELAVPPYREMYEMDPANPMARLFYIWVLGLNGQTQAAIEAAGPAAMAAGHTLPERLAGFLADALAGRPSQRAWQLQPQEREVASASEMFARFLAYGYAWAGEHDEAVRWLAIAVERGFINHPFVSAHSPAFDNMRAMPAFRALLDDMRQRWAAFEG